VVSTNGLRGEKQGRKEVDSRRSDKIDKEKEKRIVTKLNYSDGGSSPMTGNRGGGEMI